MNLMNRGSFIPKWENNSKDPKVRPTYKVWNGMLRRCRAPNDPEYANYGGRGIAVCERWNSFDAFVDDMGFVPKGLSIDRIDNEQDYDPSNCRWATRKEQANNKRTNVFITVEGKTATASQWAEKLGIPATRILSRIRAGKSVDIVLDSRDLQRIAQHGSARKYVAGCRCEICIVEHKSRARIRYRRKNPTIKNRSKYNPNKEYDL